MVRNSIQERIVFLYMERMKRITKRQTRQLLTLQEIIWKRKLPSMILIGHIALENVNVMIMLHDPSK